MCQLQHEVARRTKSGESKGIALMEASKAKRSPSDRACTEQWGSLQGTQGAGHWDSECRRNDDILRIHAVLIAPCCLKIRTKVFQTRAAPAANTAGPIDPGGTDTIAFANPSH